MSSIKDLQANPETLVALVTTKMPFGKYKGQFIADLPSAYLAWFMRQGMPSGKLGVLLITMHEIDINGLRKLLEPLRSKQF